LLAARGFVYHQYWASRARELEEAYLSDVVRTVCEAKSSRDDGQVKFSGLSRWGGQKEMTYLVISVYAAVFVFALVYTILALV
jgi:hypothetical protein